VAGALRVEMKETKRPEKKPPGRFVRAGDTEFLQNTLKRLKTEAKQNARLDELSAVVKLAAHGIDRADFHA
jgi:hypothetical protein